ncbi:MAG: methylisocitrate lyase [Chthonomonadaceae bacterium]|nr:methylisocitrate lyase [Chthonomonadaceae bacterium]
MIRPTLSDPGQALRDLMAQDTVVLPGVYDAITSVAAYKSGFSGLYLSGAALTNSQLGVPDIGLATLTEFASQASRICQAVPLPVLSDADTGFGENWNVARSVMELERSGLAGIHIEDQVMPKKCGHLDGKELISPLEMAQKVASAVQAKRSSSFIVMARTDAKGVEGLSSAIDRAKRYVDAGADAVFPEGLATEGEFEAFRGAVQVPLLANMTEFGKTPLISVDTFRQLGYEMVIFPVSAMRIALKAVLAFYAELHSTGTQRAMLDRMSTRQELYSLVDYADYVSSDTNLTP